MRFARALAAALVCLTALASGVPIRTQSSDPFNEQLLRPFTYRNLGPFRMGARTSDIACLMRR